MIRDARGRFARPPPPPPEPAPDPEAEFERDAELVGDILKWACLAVASTLCTLAFGAAMGWRI